MIRKTPAGQTVHDVDMNDIIKRGQRDQAFRLQENDVVVVPESFFEDGAQDQELHPEMSA